MVKENEKTKEKARKKAKEIKPGEIEFDWRKNTLHMQRKNEV